MRVRYVCPSATCRREVEIEIPAGDSRSTPAPTCTCGVTFKKVYTAPTVRQLTEAEAMRLFGDLDDLKESMKKAMEV